MPWGGGGGVGMEAVLVYDRQMVQMSQNSTSQTITMSLGTIKNISFWSDVTIALQKVTCTLYDRIHEIYTSCDIEMFRDMLHHVVVDDQD